MDEIKASFEPLTRSYPSGMAVNALLASKNFHIRPEHILVGNGASELIKALMERSEGSVGCILPTFEEYPNRLPADKVVPFSPTAEGFRYNAGDLIRFFSGKKISTLVLINPDNPSGNCIDADGLKQLLEWTASEGITLIVDESFLDFSKYASSLTLLQDDILAKYGNLVVVKSISKSYGVPGLRLGILASGNRELIAALKKDVAIWNINSFGEFFMQILEKYQGDYQAGCELLRAERERFASELRQIPWLEVYPSEANYLLCSLKGRFTSHELSIRLLAQNIWIKECSGKKAMDGGEFIRLSIRTTEENNRLVGILKAL